MRAAALVLALLAAPAAAQELRPFPPAALLPGIGPDDPRRPVDRRAPPWSALGRVQTEVGGRCTGALVGPRTVLTAAHCLLGPRSRQPVRPGSVHFLLGYHLGGWEAEARAVSFQLDPRFVAPTGPAGTDWALVTLERDVAPPGRALRLLPGAPALGTPALLGGYQRDRAELLLADTGCRVLGLRARASDPPVLATDCAGTRGASGAPLLVPGGGGGGWAVAGVLSAVAPNAALALAVPSETVLAAWRQ